MVGAIGTAVPAETTSSLRFATAGSVDDGKSTLVGRLLHDSKSVLADQWAAVDHASRRRGHSAPDLALLTDGLRAEREQGITIDVAYRYFATPRRRFILADTPGHVQYTRNMVTGASTADVALVLVDARKGVVEQTVRHTAVAALLRVPHVVLVVNKMDLVDYSGKAFVAVADEFAAHAARLGVPDVVAIPVCALSGENVVAGSGKMDWYQGPTLLEYLETAQVGTDPSAEPTRLPVQYVIRPQSADHPDYRGYAGQLVSGVLRIGDRVTVLPGGMGTTVTGINVLGEERELAWAPQSVSVELADAVDVARGDIIAVGENLEVTREVTATVAHLNERPLRVGDRVLVKHTTRTVRAVIGDIPYAISIAVGGVQPGLELIERPGLLAMNDLGRVALKFSEPLALDDYRDNRRTGSFLVIDPADGATLAAGMAGEAELQLVQP